MMNYKKVLSGSAVILLAALALGGCAPKATPQQKKTSAEMTRYVKNGDSSFVTSEHLDTEHNTYDVTLRDPDTLKFWSAEYPELKKLQSKKGHVSEVASGKLDKKWTSTWKHDGRKGQTKAIDHVLQLMALAAELQKSDQYGHDKHMALDIANLSRNNVINKLLYESANDSEKQVLAKNGIKGAQAKQFIDQQHQREQLQDNNTKLGSPNSHEIKVLGKQLKDSSEMMDEMINTVASPKAQKKFMNQIKSNGGVNTKNISNNDLSNL